MINPADQTYIRSNSRLLNEFESRYYIYEAEVPRIGIIMSESCQLTVWHTAEIFIWIWRRKRIMWIIIRFCFIKKESLTFFVYSKLIDDPEKFVDRIFKFLTFFLRYRLKSC